MCLECWYASIVSGLNPVPEVVVGQAVHKNVFDRLRHSGGKWVVFSPGQIHGSWIAITAYCAIPTSRTSTAIALLSDLLTLYWSIDNVVVACGRLVVGWCWRPGFPRVRPSVGLLAARFLFLRSLAALIPSSVLPFWATFWRLLLGSTVSLS